jgi:glycosyltransferase involved in cell wall biosynthesis
MTSTSRSDPTVTVAIPTFNRAALLRGCITSVLAQDHPHLCVVVHDNASTDDTAEVVASFDDERVSYRCNDENVGMFRNWKRAAELNTSDYLCLLQDDDRLLPGFVRESVALLEALPGTGFAFSLFRHVDEDGTTLGGQPDAQRVPRERRIPGSEYLHRMVAGRGWEIHASTVMMRSSALDSVGSLDAPHSDHTHDFNLYLRLASRYDIAFTGLELSEVRLHESQYTETNFRSADATGNLALMTEHVDAAAYLVASERAREPSYRTWLSERLIALNRSRSEQTQTFVPAINLPWDARLELATEEIASLVPVGATLVLLDEDKWRYDLDLPGRRLLPFLERDGEYFGPPPDADTAVREMRRLVDAGAGFVVVGWPAFWWLDFYPALRRELESRFTCLLSNSRLVTFQALP